MTPLKLPALRVLVEDVPPGTAELEKVLAEGKSRVASYLNVVYPDGQDIIFLLAGKAVKAGRFLPDGSREILTAAEALNKLRAQRPDTVSYYEISKLAMIVIMGTFLFEPSQQGLKSKLINFASLLTLFERKGFTGYLELRLEGTLNYLTFFNGQVREGYFTKKVTAEAMEFPVKLISEMVEQSDESGIINVYQSVGEEDLRESRPAVPAPTAAPAEDAEKNQFTAEILDLCLTAIYDELFRLMAAAVSDHLPPAQAELFFRTGLKQAQLQFPELFAGVTQREDGTPLPPGAVNFERMMKTRDSIPEDRRDLELQRGINLLAFIWLNSLHTLLGPQIYQGLRSVLNERIAVSRKNYQGNMIIKTALYELQRVVEKVQEPAGG